MTSSFQDRESNCVFHFDGNHLIGFIGKLIQQHETYQYWKRLLVLWTMGSSSKVKLSQDLCL